MSYKLLVMNMGSSSSKIAVFDGEECLWSENLDHPREELAEFASVREQYAFRKKALLAEVDKHNGKPGDFSAFVSRGGIIRPVPGGVWAINAKMLEDAWSGKYGMHPCSLSGQIAYDLGLEYGKAALTVDPPMSSELCDEATFSGLPEIERIAAFHALNQRAIARKYAKDHDKNYAELNLIGIHIGGGISVAAHAKGKIIDVNNALAGDGPFAGDRAGGLPTGDLIKLCYSGKYSQAEMLRRVNGGGGLYAYLGLTDARKVQERIDAGDEYARRVTHALAYQIAKEVGAMAAVLGGRVDAIFFTAGMAHWSYFVNLIRERVEFIAPIAMYPGENEMLSLAEGAVRCLSGLEKAQEYQ